MIKKIWTWLKLDFLNDLDSLHKIWIIARHDLILWKRTPFAIACALIPPLTMTMMLVALSLAVIQQPMALVVKSKGENTDKMQKIIQSDTDAYVNYDFTERLKTLDEETAYHYLNSQLVAGVITIPENFEENVKKGKANVVLTLNNVDIDFSDDIRRSVDRSVAHFDAPILSPDDLAELEGESEEESNAVPEEEEEDEFLYQANPYRVVINEHDLRETDVEWMNYQIIPALVLLILNVGLIGTALLCAYDVEHKTAKCLLVATRQKSVLIIGRMLGGVIACIIALIPAMLLCMKIGFIKVPENHWIALIIIFLVTSICASALGIAIGSILRGTKKIAMASVVIATYMYFLGGGFTTIEFLPQWLRDLSAFIPMRYAIQGMRQALFYTTLDGVFRDIIVLSSTAVVCIILGSIAISRSWTD
jgi:hypothetical protein